MVVDFRYGPTSGTLGQPPSTRHSESAGSFSFSLLPQDNELLCQRMRNYIEFSRSLRALHYNQPANKNKFDLLTNYKIKIRSKNL